ncbi:low molecular weight protein-tyrosine-phosphatase [Arthrobacter sp. TMP15]|uniref:low molecular weight protein-tyrosine-phosphatase n=1 Tax=Arthrobacter sp. TMP15 TaxID=3140789 RepID=UPI0031BB6D98
MTTPYRIMTVCTGNICRSPMAEYMLVSAATEAGLDLEIDSCGTTAWEVGNAIDPRAKALLARHGIESSDHRARAFNPRWFTERDLILALDIDHFQALQALAPDAAAAAKIRMLRSFDPALSGAKPKQQGIYDPWFGDAKDFQVSWDLIAAAIPGILAHTRG